MTITQQVMLKPYCRIITVQICPVQVIHSFWLPPTMPTESNKCQEVYLLKGHASSLLLLIFQYVGLCTFQEKVISWPLLIPVFVGFCIFRIEFSMKPCHCSGRLGSFYHSSWCLAHAETDGRGGSGPLLPRLHPLHCSSHASQWSHAVHCRQGHSSVEQIAVHDPEAGEGTSAARC